MTEWKSSKVEVLAGPVHWLGSCPECGRSLKNASHKPDCSRPNERHMDEVELMDEDTWVAAREIKP